MKNKLRVLRAGRSVYESFRFTPVNQHLSPEAIIEMELKLQSKKPVSLPPG